MLLAQTVENVCAVKAGIVRKLSRDELEGAGESVDDELQFALDLEALLA